MAVVIGYLLVSLAIHHRVIIDLSAVTTGRVSADAGLFTWWLAWVPYAIGHGENPLYTTWMHYPVGVNAMWNTAVPVLAVLFAPVTLAAGAVVAYNAAMILGPVASGIALVLALHPYVGRLWPRAVAGLVYGFSPFMLAHASVGHLNLVWAVFPPALVYTVHAILIREQPRPLRAGFLLGAAFAVQTGIYTQTVALGALALLVAALVLAVRWPGFAVMRARQVGIAAASCIGTYAVLCAYPLYLLLAGPSRPRVPIRRPGEYVTDLANVVVPTELTWWQPFPPRLAGQMRGYPGEQGGYLGIVLLAVLLLAVVGIRRAPVRVTAAVGLLLLVLSLGPSIVVSGRDTGVPGPWVAVADVPLVHEAEPMRLQQFVALCVAILLAYWVDHVARARPKWAVAAAVLAVATWIPADGVRVSRVDVPAVFTSDALKPGDVVETYPPANGVWEAGGAALQWQVASGLRYRTTSGYFIGADAEHPLLLEAPPSLFQIGSAAITMGQPPPDPVATRRELHGKAVTTDTVGVDTGGTWLFRLPR